MIIQLNPKVADSKPSGNPKVIQYPFDGRLSQEHRETLVNLLRALPLADLELIMEDMQEVYINRLADEDDSDTPD